MQRPSLSSFLSFVVAGAGAAGLAACGDDGPPPVVSDITAYAVSGDFAVTGVFSLVDVEDRVVQPNALAGVAGGDPFLRDIGAELFIINRDRGENVTIIDPSSQLLVSQYGTGGGSNPQDVAFVRGKLYIPALGTAGVVVANRDTHATSTITIPGDPDGQPNCVSAFAVRDLVVVACGLLDAAFMPRGNTLVAVIDSNSDAVIDTFELPAANPVGMFVATPADSVWGGDLLIATAPSFTDFTTGCVARVSTGTTPAANGCAVTNMALGGVANHIDMARDQAWIAVTGFAPDFSSQFGRLHAIDLATGTVGPAISPGTHRADDVTACRDGYVVTADGTAGASGLRIWKDGVETTTAPLDIGRPTGFGNTLACL